MKSLILAAALFAAVPAAAVNVVTNGDFSAGNSGFSSAYTYKSSPYSENLAEGNYAVDTSAANTHFAWVDLADHTGDAAALYQIANGAGTDVALWEQTVTVTPFTTYNFSAWVADVCCNANAANLAGQSPPSFTFRVIDGATTTTLDAFTSSTYGVWEQVGGTYVNGASTSLTLRIINLNNTAAGNDLGLDDISFAATVPEPASWALLVAGFGLVGVSLRRRTGAVAA